MMKRKQEEENDEMRVKDEMRSMAIAEGMNVPVPEAPSALQNVP